MQDENKKSAWLQRPIFQKPADFYALLDNQAETTLEGMEALYEWFKNGASERCQKVRDLERAADQLKLDLTRKLVESFVTPIDREEIYDLSARLDEVINSAKSVVREVEALEVVPYDSYLLAMAEILVEGTRCLKQSFASLKDNPQKGSEQAYLARKSENRFIKVYRQATRELFMLDDWKRVLRTKEVYRDMLQAADKIDRVAEKLIHVIIKIS